MTLREWIDRQGSDPEAREAAREAIANACGCREVNVRHWYNGTRPIPAKHALAVECVTGGKVKAVEIIRAAA